MLSAKASVIVRSKQNENKIDFTGLNAEMLVNRFKAVEENL